MKISVSFLVVLFQTDRQRTFVAVCSAHSYFFILIELFVLLCFARLISFFKSIPEFSFFLFLSFFISLFLSFFFLRISFFLIVLIYTSYISFTYLKKHILRFKLECILFDFSKKCIFLFLSSRLRYLCSVTVSIVKLR